MTKPIGMLALDLDGTLAIDPHGVMPATRDALTRLHASGVEVVIATGRRYRTTRFVIDNLGFDVFAVCNGGALVKSDKGETLAETNFSAEQNTAIVEIARQAGLTLFGQRDAHSRTGADFVVDDVSPWQAPIESYFADNRQWATRGDLTNQHNTEYLVKGTFGDEHSLRSFADKLLADHGDMFTTIVVPHLDKGYHYCEITLAHVDKWWGLQTLLEKNGLDADQLAAAGDQLNDVPMLQATDHSFRMSNGNPALADIARHSCGAHDADGLLDVVRYIETYNRNASQ